LDGPTLFSSSIVRQCRRNLEVLRAQRGGVSREQRLLADAMLGKLVTYLRMCGYDTVYAPDAGLTDDDAIRALARAEERTLLTRNRDLGARAADAVVLTSKNIDGKLAELADAGVELSLSEPCRCGNCNGELERVPPTTETPEHAPDPAETDVWQCHSCGQRFWKGSHWDDVAGRLAGH
jgi:uncharacterized protein with PIN domain